MEARSKVGDGTVRSMEGDSVGGAAGGKISWDRFNLRRKVGEVGELGVDCRLPDLSRPPGLFDMAKGHAVYHQRMTIWSAHPKSTKV